MRHLLTIADLRDDEIRQICQSARHPIDFTCTETRPHLVGLLFVEPSLRTRIGFSAASARLGWSHVDVRDLVWHPGMSEPESYWDTLRVLSGMTDVIVTRAGLHLEANLVTESSQVPVISGGDAGNSHPTQSLVDLAAIESLAGPVHQLNVGICGDLGMRAAISLMQLLARTPPARLTLMAPPSRDIRDDDIPESLQPSVAHLTELDATSVDVLYLSGLPEGQGARYLDAAARRRFTVTPDVLRTMPHHSIVLSPMPVIDEIDPACRTSPQVRIYQQADLAVRVRAEILRLVAGWK